MKILIVTARYYPETFSITNIAESLVLRGHEVTVVTGLPSYGKWALYAGYETVRDETINGVKVHRLDEEIRTKGVFGLIKNYISINKIYSDYFKKLEAKYDVVLSHVMSPIFTIKEVGNYCKRNNVKQMLYGLDIWPESLVAAGYVKKHSLVFNYFKKLSINIYNQCDLITYASPSVEYYLKNYLKIDVPFKHIYQPCLTKVPTSNLVSNHDYKANSKLNILFCGTVAQFNHLDLMINAINKCKNKENIIFHIVGSGSALDKIKKTVNKNKLNSQVKFYGRIPSEETIKHYVNADVLFVPLFWNSATSNMIPQKLIEYFMYNRPILGMLKGDGADLLKSASTLNLIADQTVESLSAKIDAFFSYNQNEFASCGQDNRNCFLNEPRFQLETIVDEIEKELINLSLDKSVIR